MSYNWFTGIIGIIGIIVCPCSKKVISLHWPTLQHALICLDYKKNGAHGSVIIS